MRWPADYVRRAPTHAAPGDLAKLGLDHRQQAPERAVIAAPPLVQESGDVGGIVRDARDVTPRPHLAGPMRFFAEPFPPPRAEGERTWQKRRLP